jgi:DNA-binding NtrC family response regulator
MSQQAKLLRVLQSGEFTPVGSSKIRRVDVRVLAATNVSMQSEVGAGRFREDLFYRLNTVEIALPPLRERREDIPRLAMCFLELRCQKYGRPGRTFTAGALQALVDHSWPGNVRELEHVVERAFVLAHGPEIDSGDLMLRPRGDIASRVEEMTLEEAERYLIQKALGRAGGNATEAARALGLSRSAFYRRLQHFGLRGTG